MSCIVADVMLPGSDGWQIMQALSAKTWNCLVIFLTPRDPVRGPYSGLELGEDDDSSKAILFNKSYCASARCAARRIRESDVFQVGGSSRRSCAARDAPV